MWVTEGVIEIIFPCIEILIFSASIGISLVYFLPIQDSVVYKIQEVYVRFFTFSKNFTRDDIIDDALFVYSLCIDHALLSLKIRTSTILL